MKGLKIDLVIALLVGLLSVIVISKTSYAADMDKSSITIKAYQDKIAVEWGAIIADGRRLQEVKKTGDKAKIEQVKQEVGQDIEKRKATIRALYKDMENPTRPKSDGGKKKKKW